MRPLLPCCEAPFAGAYFGAALGYARSNEVTSTTRRGSDIRRQFKDNDGGVTVGGYVGYNWQRCCSPIVFGVETDFNYINTSPTALDIETGPTAPTETTSLKSRMDWFGTLRGRAGMWSMTIGCSMAPAVWPTEGSITSSAITALAVATQTSILDHFAQSNSDTKVGWTAGGGVEFLHDAHWLVRAEALFVDFGSETHTYTPDCTPFACTATAKWDDQFYVARVGLAYKFGEPDRVVPLK